MNSIFSLKSALRLEVTQRIKSLPENIQASESKAIQQHLLSLDIIRKSRSVCVYHSFVGEVATDLIYDFLFAENKKIYVPWVGTINNQSVMKMLEINSPEDLVPSGVFKNKTIYQPSNPESRRDAIQNGDLDVVIVPGVAFTKDGNRLGRGKGYYDGFLWDLKRNYTERSLAVPFTVGVGFSVQKFDEIPVTEKDYRLDSVVFGGEV